MQQERTRIRANRYGKQTKKSPENKFWDLSIWNKLNQALVRECDVRWNSIVASLLIFYRKMLDLGFTFDGSDVVYPNHGETSNG